MKRYEELMEKARHRTGLDEFGEGSFVEGLERLLWAFDHEADLTTVGAAALDEQVVELLSQRLQVEQCLVTYPQIGAERIEAPLIGLGLPRTGSTAFSYLLAQDPQIRYPRHWEVYQPCPPPEADTRHSDARIARSEQVLAISFSMFPRLKMMLPASATGPTECQQIMGHDFKSLAFSASARIPTYTRWLLHEADLVSTFRYLRRVLQLLQWHCPPNRWRLKNPNHCLFLPALNQVFPDARFWMTHRDPALVLPSVCNVYEELTQPYTLRVDRKCIAAMNLEWTELGMRRVMEFRDHKAQNHRFFDVQFEELQQDPLPSIERLYVFLGEQLTEPARRNMQQWWQDSRREQSTTPGYTLEGFDLDFQEIERRFHDYSERFSVPQVRPVR
jgi:hypothetical protein